MRREIIRLDQTRQAEAIDIWRKAFAEDPMFQSLFQGESQTEADALRRDFCSFILNKGILLRGQLIGVCENGVLKCAACIEHPGSMTGAGLLLRPRFLCDAFGLFLRMPRRSFTLMNRYMRLTQSVRPPSPHHYLVLIGVDPDHQGRGFGRLLLEHIHELVDWDPVTSGIGLDTENPDNVKLYERFGYRLTAAKPLGDIMVYCMFRPKPH